MAPVLDMESQVRTTSVISGSLVSYNSNLALNAYVARGRAMQTDLIIERKVICCRMF